MTHKFHVHVNELFIYMYIICIKIKYIYRTIVCIYSLINSSVVVVVVHKKKFRISMETHQLIDVYKYQIVTMIISCKWKKIKCLI